MIATQDRLLYQIIMHKNHAYPLQWLHDCLLNHLLRRRSKKTSKLRATGPYAGNSPVTGEFPPQRAVTPKMFPFDDVIMSCISNRGSSGYRCSGECDWQPPGFCVGYLRVLPNCRHLLWFCVGAGVRHDGHTLRGSIVSRNLTLWDW